MFCFQTAPERTVKGSHGRRTDFHQVRVALRGPHRLQKALKLRAVSSATTKLAFTATVVVVHEHLLQFSLHKVMRIVGNIDYGQFQDSQTF